MIFYQVTKKLCSRNIINRFVRFVNTEPIPKVLVPLNNRKVLKISGDDAPEFLQGLVTNDMRHFTDGAKSMYAMFLNNKGRVLYDTLIHRWESDTSFLVECDKSVFGLLFNHLKLYKLKRDVKLEDVNPLYRMWALISQINLVTDAEIDPQSPINIYKDPRLAELGCRLVTLTNLNAPEVQEMIALDDINIADEDVYRYLRYKLGVGEGPEDLPPGACFPLEANCDYLHGVSFHKGCYIGQELTARIYHTGVIRKRMMPLKFTEDVADYIEQDTVITASSNPKLNLGKLKGFVHDYGLGLVRIKEALESKTLKVGPSTAEIIKPEWWPMEAPKEKLTKTD